MLTNSNRIQQAKVLSVRHHRAHTVETQTASVNRRRNKLVPKRVHLQQRRQTSNVTKVVAGSPSVIEGHADGSEATMRVVLPSRRFSPMNRKAKPARLDHHPHNQTRRQPAPRQPSSAARSPQANHRLVKHHVVQYRTQRVVGVLRVNSHFHGL